MNNVRGMELSVNPMPCGYVNIVSAGVMVVRVGYWGYKWYKVCELFGKEGDRTREETIHLVTEVVLGILETADLVSLGCYHIFRQRNDSFLNPKPNLYKGLQLTIRSCMAVGRIAEAIIPITKRGDDVYYDRYEQWTNLVGVVLMQVANVAEVGIDDPQYTDRARRAFENVAAAGMAGGLLVEIVRGPGRNTMFVIAEWARRQFNPEPARPNEERNDPSHPDNGQIPVLIAPETVQNVPALHGHFDGIFNDVINWQNLQEIPAELRIDVRLQQFVCRITGIPIRFIALPRGIVDVYYERAEINRWLQEQPAVLPPGWPENLPFNQENTGGNAALQQLIDAGLARIAAEWQALANGHD